MPDLLIPEPVALKNLPDVELVALGTWMASTGKTVITDDDLRAAISALDCPGVHNPVIKLGHDEPDPDGQHMRWDGEPAVGWISNMRLSDNEAKILGDYTGVPAWLIDVMPSAYPQRSVELRRDFLCQIGHIHPFVITAVSLLGVYPPAVGVIKSLNDVQALYTLAASDGTPAWEIRRSIEISLAAADGDPRRDLTDAERQSTADFDRDRREWEAAITALLAVWPTIGRAQRDQLTAQIADHIDQGHLDELAAMTVDVDTATRAVYEEMLRSAYEALDEQKAEARRQGVLPPPDINPDEKWLYTLAAGISATMASTLAATAGRDAAQLAGPGLTGRDVAAAVGDKLAGLSDRFLRDQFGGAVGAARSAGRYAVLSVLPTGEYYAAEVNDTRTCGPCKSIDGTLFDTLDEAISVYGGGGYNGCLGGGRCRGRMVTVWEAEAAPIADIPPAPPVADVTGFRVYTRRPVTMSLTAGGPAMPLPTTIKAKVSAEDISRAYYQSAGYSNWITTMHLDPLELVVCDDASGDYFRIPVTLSGDTFEFGSPVQVQVEYVDVKTPKGNTTKASAAIYAADDGVARLGAFAWHDRAEALSVVGGEPAPPAATTTTTTTGGQIDFTPIAPTVTPAGAAIRAMAAATQTPPAAVPADGSPTTTKEAARMPFDAAKLREALGLAEDARPDDTLTAFVTALSQLGGTSTPADSTSTPDATLTAGGRPPAYGGDSPPVVPPRAGEAGAVLLDPDTLAQLQESARKGETAWAQLKRNERDSVLDGAIKMGKFPVARREYWVQLWDRDPEGTRSAINALAANVIPILSAGYLGDDTAQRSVDDQAYAGLFGKDGE